VECGALKDMRPHSIAGKELGPEKSEDTPSISGT
jgi:hypothetical protein